MKHYIFVGLLSALLTAGCACFRERPNLQNVVNELDVAQESFCYSVKPFRKGALPVPADRLMLMVKRAAAQSVPAKEFSFDVENDGTLISQFNSYAAAKITSGADYDPIAERKNFLLEKCGKAAAPLINEYFRILERYTNVAFFCRSTLRPNNLRTLDVYEEKMFDQLDELLKKAVAAAAGTDYAAVIQQEYEFFSKYKNAVLDDWQRMQPILPGGRSALYWQELSGIIGDPVKVPSFVKCYLSEDQKSMVLRLIANEPNMAKRKISGTGKDFNKAWADDRFEIFIIPDPDDFSSCKQFIITSGRALWDAQVPAPGIHDSSWNSNAVYNQFDVEGAWRAELIIPFADFGIDGIPKKPFLINIYRFRSVHGEKDENSAWSPIRIGSNVQPDRFGKIIWER